MAPTAQQINKTLEKILSHGTFHSSPKLSSFLRYIVEQTIDGQGSRLKQYTIATELFGKEDDFDPALDPIVRMQASKLRKSLDAYYQSEPEGLVVRITLPKGSYQPNFELIDKSSASVPQPLLEDAFPSIAVLPFTCLDNKGSSEVENMVGSFHQELNLALSKFEQLTVLSSLRVDELIEEKLSLSEVKSALNAKYLLAGNTRTVGSKIRVTVTLSESEHGRQVWSERFECSADEASMYDEQDRLVVLIASKVGSAYGVISLNEYSYVKRIAKNELNGYQARLCYLEYLTHMTRDGLHGIRELYEDLVAGAYASDAQSLAILSQIYCDSFLFGELSLEQVQEKCALLVAKAMDYAPLNNEVLLAQAWWALLAKKPQRVAGCAERIMQLNPSSTYTLGAAGWLVCLSGNFDFGLSTLKLISEREDYYPSWLKLAIALNAVKQGNIEQALSSIELFYFEGNPLQTILLALIYKIAKQHDLAQQHWQEALLILPNAFEVTEQLLTTILLDSALSDSLDKALQSFA
jgi:adenylate cyclase